MRAGMGCLDTKEGGVGDVASYARRGKGVLYLNREPERR